MPPFPGAENAVVSQSKLTGYLLNSDHPVGSAKAAWFLSLGYQRDHWSDLASDLLKIARTTQSFISLPSPFGVKYIVVGLIGRPNFRVAKVSTVWLVEGNNPPRLITAYPEE